jgi:hypothetical protein
MSKNLKRWMIIGLFAWALLAISNGFFKNWVVLEAISTWMLAGGLFFAILQVYQARKSTDEARKSTNAQIAVELFKELRSDKALEILRYIYRLGPKENGKNLTNIHKDNITYVLERLGMLGALVANGIIDEKIAIEAFGGVTILKCWYQLKDYIEEVQKHQGLQWGRYAEDFASRALEHWKGYQDKWVLYYRNEGDEPIDLVKKLSTDKKLCPKRLKKELPTGEK